MVGSFRFNHFFLSLSLNRLAQCLFLLLLIVVNFLRSILLTATLVMAVSSINYAQSCSCKELERFQQKRDVDSVGKYTYTNYWLLSEKLALSTNRRCQAFAFNLKASVQLKHDQFLDALYSLERERGILDSIHCKSSAYLDHFVVYGDYFIAINEFNLAIEYYGKANKLAQKLGNKSQLARIFLGLSTAFARLNDTEKSLFYTTQAYPIVKTMPDNEFKVEGLLDLSSRYVKLFRLSKKRFYLDSADVTVNFAYALAKRLNYSDSYWKAYNILEDGAYYRGNYRVALLYFDSALALTSSPFLLKERGAIYGDMTDIFLEIKKYDKAYQYADSNLVYAKLSGNPYELRNAYELLYNTAKLSGDYERALTLYQELTVLKDSVEQLKNDKAFSQLQEKYHRIRKEKSNAEYEQDQRLLAKQREIGALRKKLIVVGIVILALMGAYVFMVFRQRNIKSKQKRLEAEHRLQEARINPDFIFQAISKLQVKADSSADSRKNLQAYSKLLKQLLESTFNDFLTLDREMDFLSLYMDLERESKRMNFSYEFTVDPALDPQNVCVPTMLLQPFLESTIVDGFKNLPYAGKLELSFHVHKLNELAILIRDNGKGLKAIDSMRASEIINDRIYLLNELRKSQSSYLIREHSQGGVSVEIFIPLITKAYAEEIRKNSL